MSERASALIGAHYEPTNEGDRDRSRSETPMSEKRSARQTPVCDRSYFILVVLASLLLPHVPLQAAQRGMVRADLVIRHARVFDGVDWRDDATIAISGDRILDVADGASRFQGNMEIDASHWTVIPGMIDAHVHVLDNRSEVAATPRVLEQLENLLRAGVTTIQSTSDVTEDIVELRSRIAAGSVRAPRLFVTGGQIAAVGGPKLFRCAGNVRCQVNEVATEADVQKVVAELASAGVNGVKFVVDRDHERTLSLPLVRAIIEAAHAHSLRALGHIDHAGDARAAVDFGLDVLLHPVPWRTGAVDEIAELLARNALPVTTTLSLRLPHLAQDGSMTMVGGADYPDNRYRLLQHGLEVVGALHRAGVPLAAGTDTALRQRWMPAEKRYMRELQLMVEAGLSTTEVLRAATRNAARHLGAPDLGVIAPANVADLVILAGNPEKNVLEVETILVVVKAGRIVVDNRER